VFAASSFDDFGDLARAAMRAAVPAVWFVPAVLFLRGGTLTEAAFGLFLLANAIRLLAAVRPPRRLSVKKAPSRVALSKTNPFITQTLPVIGGALLLQAGLAATLARTPAVAATLVACGSAVVAWWWASARTERRETTYKSMAVTVLGAILLTLLQLHVELNPAIASAEVKPSVMPLTGGIEPKDIKTLSGKSLVPGVILRPGTKPQKIQATGLLPATRHGILKSRPVVLAFTGEYHLFPTSSGRVQPDSTVIKGTPLDAVYASMSGGVIQTEAYQPMYPPIDLANCGRIHVRIRTAEQSPAAATMHLITTAGQLELGMEIFGLQSGREETVEFAVPPPPANLMVKAIRIVFLRDPMNRSQSTKVEVVDFTLVPRILGEN
jgi:hypothetical protein